MKARHFGAAVAAMALTLGAGSAAFAAPYNIDASEDRSSDVNINILNNILNCNNILGGIGVLGSGRGIDGDCTAISGIFNVEEEETKVWDESVDKSKRHADAKTYVKAKKKAYGEAEAENE